MFHYYYPGWGLGMGFMMLFMLIFWVGVILLIWLLVRWLAGRGYIPEGKGITPKPEDRPLEILKTRYAKGEISQEEYERMKRDIEG